MTMYNPEPFRVEDKEAALTFISSHDFAIIASHGELCVTHTPMTIIHRDDPITLFGHFSRKNPHCNLLDGKTRQTCIFAGPHTYVSPSWYETNPAVPTWNYSAVHVTGTASAITEETDLKKHLLSLTARHDPQLNAEDYMPVKFMRGMMKGIVGFTLSVEKIEFKHKLSQNRPNEDRRAVAATLSRSDNTEARAVADAMQQFFDD